MRRDEEVDLRRKLIEMDLVECVIGLGPNLFFNSPMEACIVICRTQKPVERRGKILFINAVDEVTRKNAQSFLENTHIKHISSTYLNYSIEEDYSTVGTIEEIKNNQYSLNLPLYVRREMDMDPILTVNECVDDWESASINAGKSIDALLSMISEE